MHFQIVTFLIAAHLWPPLTLAVPAPGSKIVIDTEADVVVNKVVSTVTIAANAANDCTHGSTTGAVAAVERIEDSHSSSRPSSPGATTVLAPAVPPYIDTSQHANLMPNVLAQLFYLQPQASANLDTTQNASVAAVSVPQMNYPTVNLLMTSYVAGLTCSNSSATVTFNDQKAYQLAATNWTQAIPFVLVTYHDECGGAHSAGEHGFLVVQTLSTAPSGLAIQLNVNHVDFQHAVGPNNTVTVDLGSFSPSGNGKFNTSTAANNTKPAGGTKNSGLDDSFDQALDDSYGPSISLADTRKWSGIFPNVSTAGFDNTTNLVDGFPVLIDRRRSLHKRGFFGDIGRFFTETIPETIQKVPDVVQDTVDKARDGFEAAARKAAGVLDNFTYLDKSLDKDFFVNQYPSNGDSPWGRAYSIYGADSIKGCGVNGEVRVTGKVTFSIAEGIKQGSISAVGSLHSVLQLRLVADGLSKNIPIADQTLASLSLGDLVLPGILNIGPSITLGAGAALEVGATGKLLAGAILDWPTIDAELNVADPGQGKADGFSPSITPIFSADGTVSTTLDMWLKASLGFTIGLFNIDKLTKSIELIDQPGIRGTATVSGSAKLVDGRIEGEFTGPCAGVDLSANIYNKVFVDLAGFDEITLADWSSPSLSRCVKIGKRELDDVSTTQMSRLAYNHGHDTAVQAVQRRDRAPFTSNPRPESLIGSPWHKRQQNSTKVAATHANAGSRTLNQQSNIHNEDASGAADNATFSVVESMHGDFDLHWATNGNVYVIPSNDNNTRSSDSDSGIDMDTAHATAAFTVSHGVIIGDSHGRVLHGYTNELSTYNVSRVRLHIAETLPKTSRAIALRMMTESGGGEEFLGAHDTSGNALIPIACAYSDKHPKLFLAEDHVLGVQTLQNTPDITGPNVSACGAIRFHKSGASQPSGP